MNVSIREISELTGFSAATISNALNRKKGVNKETSEKIFQVAQELGYTYKEKNARIRFVTTIQVLRQKMGQIAVNRLLDKLQEPSRVRTKIQICTDFLERGSVAERKMEG